MVTWPNHPKRLEYLRQVLESLQKYLTASQHSLRYYCSSETEPDPKYTWHGDEVAAVCKEYGVALSWRDPPADLGGNMNAALRLCSSELILLVQDDYKLIKPLDLSIGARFLETTPDVDIVRYQWPGLGADGPRCILQDHPDGWRRAVGGRIYGDDPHLRRRSLTDKAGWYVENRRHALAEGSYWFTLHKLGIGIAVADQCYFHNIGWVPTCINNPRPSQKDLRKDAANY